MTDKTIPVPRSEQFDDVYFSVHDGLAETQHVFLAGNDLPQRWRGRDHFTICETGFGTGLNFLAALQMWKRDPERPDNLHFISFEKFPLDRDFIEQSLFHWGELSELSDVFLSNYPSDLHDGIHKFYVVDGVQVTLIFGDVNDAIPVLNDAIDCWFLDGFKPSSNPDMWSDIVFQNMARLSNRGASFATFTAAGFVRRGLQGVGFDVRKVCGFGRKREMAVGRYLPDL
ncbi:MAG: tRNA (5-methylaminomethyl-2-thiouridine)(34)-methyltransferase MnmD [Alphaproteobacteria bacterium]